MTSAPYTAPSFQSKAFNCPFCGTFAHQSWFGARGLSHYEIMISDLNFSQCLKCDDVAFWFQEKLLYPKTRTAPPANQDMCVEGLEDYEEAARIEHDSPKGAAALLRLCVQRLCVQLGEPG